jgi:hypothetical protein
MYVLLEGFGASRWWGVDAFRTDLSSKCSCNDDHSFYNINVKWNIISQSTVRSYLASLSIGNKV